MPLARLTGSRKNQRGQRRPDAVLADNLMRERQDQPCAVACTMKGSSVAQTAQMIRQYRYAEEQMMRIMAGWIALTPELGQTRIRPAGGTAPSTLTSQKALT